ncbi:ArnT family glycosyltransferase [Nodosilinea nodulosa]|uniref:ArnT family glycosyltransferase n=1 Tax=Nodosilinea nodulosa TaxID=416001 RepID=UPI0002FC1E6E|nr:glycosyltransferase family 39 protein [Nodosilinea nodulosa]
MVPNDIYKPIYRLFWRLRRQPWLWLLLWVAPLLLLNRLPQSLLAPREGIYAQQAWDMLTYNDWIGLGWWGTPQFDRLPGLHYLIALSYHWFGRSELAARLPSMVAAGAAIWLTWRLGQRLTQPTGSPQVGLWGAGIFAVMPLWMQAAKLATPDALLVSLSLLAVWALLHSEDQPAQRIGWGLVAGLALSFGFLVGGAIAVLPLVALLPYLVWGHRTHRHLTNIGLYYGLVFGAVPTAIWLGRAVARYGDLPLGQLAAHFTDQLGRVDGPTVPQGVFQSSWGATAGGFYSLGHLPLVTFPWLGFALVGAWLVGRDRRLGRRTLWLGYPTVLVGLLCLTPARAGSEDLLVYPFVALLAAVGLNHLGRLFRSRAARRYRVAVGLSWAAGVGGILLMSTGAALLITPGELIAADLRPYGWLGVAGGLGLLLPWLMALNRWGRVSQAQQRLWQWGWLLGPWLAVMAAFATGLFGNYGADVAQALQPPPVAEALAHNPVYMVQPSRDRIPVLLTVYTPHLGKPLGNWSQIPSLGYAWVQAAALPLAEGYEVIATVGDWQLVQAPVVPEAVPRG